MTKTTFIGYRPTWAEVNLRHIAYNLTQVKRFIAPAVKLMCCVKADAYGHGLIPVSRKLVDCKVDWLAVASIDEGIRLRQARIRVPILVLGLMLKKDIEPIFQYRLTPTVCDEASARILNDMARRRINKPIAVHIKVDTGMGRIGVLSGDAEKLVRLIHGLKFIRIEGLFTHLALADSNRKFTVHQIGLFNRLVERLDASGIHIPLLHAANSMAVIDYPQSHFNMVRPGLVLYGLYPKEGIGVTLRPVLSLKTRAIFVKRVPSNYGISYGHAYVTKQPATIVTLPIGYGDGYPRDLTNRAPVLIKGGRFRVSGRICMDQMMIDVGNVRVRVGDEVVLIGRQGKEKITTEELAQLSGTIPYEIVCGLGSRIPRIYIE